MGFLSINRFFNLKIKSMYETKREPEQWKPIKGYEGLYEISNYGRVKTLERDIPISKGGFWTVKECILKQNISTSYAMIGLSFNGKKQRRTIHSLVAEHFLSNPNSLKIINHKDEDKLNNYYKNLEWVTVRENQTYSIDKTKTSSKYTGVHYKHSMKTSPWCSCICIKGKTRHLGYFTSELEAHEAYLDALKTYNLKNKYALKSP